MNDITEVCAFLKKAGTYYLATAEGDQPRVRPFGTAHVYEGKLYIQTGLRKSVAHQIAKNPKVEICAFLDGSWLRLSGTLVHDGRIAAERSLLAEYPELGKMYQAGDGNNAVYFFKDATAVFSSFTAPARTIRF